MSGRWLAVLTLFALLAAACTSESAAMTLDEYGAAMQAVETSFAGDGPDLAGPTENQDQYPLGGDLVGAYELYSKFENRLAGWRAITPPSSVAELHERLVGALDAIQSQVGDYLSSEAMTGVEFEFESIGLVVGPFLRDATTACSDLQSALQASGVSVAFAGDCGF